MLQWITRARHAILFAGLALSIAACGAGGAKTGQGSAPATPAGVVATPGSATTTVGWSAVSGAASYNVYTSATPTVTKASNKSAVTGTSTAIAGINGTPQYFAVTAVNAAGESALSPVACALPSVGAGAAVAAGLTLYDGLCETSSNASKWLNTQFNRSIQNGTAVLFVEAGNFPQSDPGHTTPLSVVNPTSEFITQLQSDISVASSNSVVTSPGLIQAHLEITAQPAADSAAISPVSTDSVDLMVLRVGLEDSGSGLTVYRNIGYCVDAGCFNEVLNSAVSGLNLQDGAFPAGAAAQYDTTYTFAITLDPSTNLVSYTVSGGSFGSTPLTGQVDITPILTATGVVLASDFPSGKVRVRAATTSGTAQGGEAKVQAAMGNVMAAFSTTTAAGALTALDTFSGTGNNGFGNPNSGPNLDSKTWSNAISGHTLPGGLMSFNQSVGSTASQTSGTSTSSAAFMTFSGYESAPTSVQMDESFLTQTGTTAGELVLLWDLYNDGTGSTAVNPTTALGDVLAEFVVGPGGAIYEFFHCGNAACSSGVDMGTGTIPFGSIPFGLGTLHTLRMSQNAAHQVTFQLDDGAPLTVDPTVSGTIATPVVPKPAFKPAAQIGFKPIVSVPGASSAATITGTISNFFVK